MARTLLAALVVCLFAQSLPGQQEQLAPSESVFAVLAAINAAGYDEDADSLTNHSLRALVRNKILSAHPPVLPELKKFYETHKAADPANQLAQYISFALSNDGPPAFEYKFQLMQRPPEVIALNGFEKLLASLWQEAKLEDVWRSAQPVYDEALERYHAPVTEMVSRCSGYLRSPAEGYFGRTFQIIPALQGAPNQVQVRSYATEFFIVLTPSADLHVDDIETAYLQFLVDPLMGMQSEKLAPKRDVGDLAGGSPILADAYKDDFRLLAAKSLILAVEARLAPAAKREGMVEEAMREGFVLTAYFYEQLPAYEKQDQAMRFYLGDMIDHIDPVKESARIAKVHFLEEPPVRMAKVTPAEQRIRAEGPYRKLSDAEDLYAKKDYAAARDAYMAAIQAATDPVLQARSYFGLARIAALSHDPESAQQLFLKTLDLGPDPATLAWTHVYLARLYLAMTEPDWSKAKQHFEAALAVNGASAAARKSAEAGLNDVKKEAGAGR